MERRLVVDGLKEGKILFCEPMCIFIRGDFIPSRQWYFSMIHCSCYCTFGTANQQPITPPYTLKRVILAEKWNFPRQNRNNCIVQWLTVTKTLDEKAFHL